MVERLLAGHDGPWSRGSHRGVHNIPSNPVINPTRSLPIEDGLYMFIPYMVILELVWNFGLPKMTPNSAKQKPCVLLWRPIPINKQICFRHVDPMWKPTPSYQIAVLLQKCCRESEDTKSNTQKSLNEDKDISVDFFRSFPFISVLLFDSVNTCSAYPTRLLHLH